MAATPILQLPYPSPDDNVDVPRDIKALADAIEAHGAFVIGEIKFVAVAAAPPGFLPADGAARSRATYAKLYAVLGDLWGAGDGSSTFNVPAVAGRVLVGAGAGAGLTARAVATKWGVEAVVLSTAQIPAHAHGINDPGHFHTYYANRQFNGAGGTSFAYWDTPAGGVNDSANTDTKGTGITIQNQGGGAGHDNTQPSIAVPAYIYAGA